VLYCFCWLGTEPIKLFRATIANRQELKMKTIIIKNINVNNEQDFNEILGVGGYVGTEMYRTDTECRFVLNPTQDFDTSNKLMIGEFVLRGFSVSLSQ